MPSKRREIGAWRRHERRRALARRYRTVGELRYPRPMCAVPLIVDSSSARSGQIHAGWQEVLQQRWEAARWQLNTRTPCSCYMCGNPRRLLGEVPIPELKAACASDWEF